MTHDPPYDLFVIGGGSGGVRAARMAAQRGARVALAEAAAMGGTCVNVGCIPKKLYSYAAHYAHAFQEAQGFGWDLAPATLDWARLKANRAQEIGRLNEVYDSMLRAAGVTLVRGWAQLVDGHTVQVRTEEGERRFPARHVLIATGGTPSVPLLPGRELAVTSDSMFDLEPFPRRLAIVGGGYIACEFASIFHGLGAQVSLLYRGDQVLRGFDDDVRTFISGEMVRQGIDLRLGAQVSAMTRSASGILLDLGDAEPLIADTVLFATGRVPNTNGLGLDAAGVRQREDGAVVVDRHYRSSLPSVYAVGDVTARLQLTPVALSEAMVLVDHLFGSGTRRMDYEGVPTAVFTHPNIGTVGMTQAQAQAAGHDIDIYRTEFRPLRHTLSGSGERCLMKLVVERRTDRVLGLHMVGPEAGEIVQGFAVAMKAGATKAVFDATIGIHPTLAEEFVTLREPIR